MATESKQLYNVVVLRRQQSGQVQLNYTGEEQALAAFAKIQNRDLGKPFVDSFGTRVMFEADDIGHVLMVDAARSLEIQAMQQEMVNSVNIRLQQKAEREANMARSSGGILLARGELPKHQ